MERGMGDIVACMQELELACEALEETHREICADLRGRIRHFFAEPSVESAQDVLSFLNRLEGNKRQAAEIRIDVDNLQTSLKQLAGELEEVLEDY